MLWEMLQNAECESSLITIVMVELPSCRLQPNSFCAMSSVSNKILQKLHVYPTLMYLNVILWTTAVKLQKVCVWLLLMLPYRVSVPLCDTIHSLFLICSPCDSKIPFKTQFFPHRRQWRLKNLICVPGYQIGNIFVHKLQVHQCENQLEKTVIFYKEHKTLYEVLSCASGQFDIPLLFTPVKYSRY